MCNALLISHLAIALASLCMHVCARACVCVCVCVCVYMCVCVCVCVQLCTNIMLLDSSYSEKITNIKSNIASPMVQVLYFSSIVTLSFKDRLFAFYLMCKYLINGDRYGMLYGEI